MGKAEVFYSISLYSLFQELNAGSGSGEDGDGSEIPIDGEDIDTVVSLNH